eukprot:TRINITY_DN4757_c0_g1_i4.p1 TRINITY_DN4757_c0_g1~~TRINITY_DN4757_c0_g1_i4.p1  ORF type:complete len:299 (+),score=52.56 TRINITY_DN4757_c0_g1_i4:96-992(+)
MSVPSGCATPQSRLGTPAAEYGPTAVIASHGSEGSRPKGGVGFAIAHHERSLPGTDDDADTQVDVWDKFRAKMAEQTRRALFEDRDREGNSSARGVPRPPSAILQHSRLALELGHVLDKISEISDAMGSAKVHALDSGTLRDWSLRIDDGVREARSLGRDYAKKMVAALATKTLATTSPRNDRKEPDDIASESQPAAKSANPASGRRTSAGRRRTAHQAQQVRHRSHSMATAAPPEQQQQQRSALGAPIPLSAAEAVAAAAYLCTEAVAGLLQADRACVWLPDPRRGDLTAAVLVGYP